MEFALPKKGKLPDDFRANDSYRNKTCRWEFFMPNYKPIGVGSAKAGISRCLAFRLAADLFNPMEGIVDYRCAEKNAVGAEQPKS